MNGDGRIPTAIDRIAEEWVDRSVALHPELGLGLGRPVEGRYSDLSPEGRRADDEAERRFAVRLRAEAPADGVDAVTRSDLLRELDLSIEARQRGAALRDVNTVASPVQGVRTALDLEPTETEDDWAVVGERLANVAGALQGYGATLREGVLRGVVPARRQVVLAVDEARRYALPDVFFGDLAARAAGSAAVPAPLAARIGRAATEAGAAYGRLADLLEQEVAPAAAAEDAVGRERYALESRRFLGTAVDLDETYEWGLGELARTAAEQEAVAAEIVPGGGVEDAIAALDADPARRLEGTAALQAWMQRLSDDAVEALGAAHFDIPPEVRRLECRIAPTRSGVIYYTPPSDEFARPGRMWWSVPDGVERFTTWRETSTVYHEGVPGHHLQFATATTNRSLNTWRRGAGTSGYWEGWALYAERLMGELGFLDDPGDRLGMLDGQRLRAARVVIDIGLHLRKRDPSGAVWTRDAALALLRRHVHMDDAFLRFEVDRYGGWPGQAASYEVGERIWEQVRATAAARAGEGFDLKAFHSGVLLRGGKGLDALRASVDA